MLIPIRTCLRCVLDVATDAFFGSLGRVLRDSMVTLPVTGSVLIAKTHHGTAQTQSNGGVGAVFNLAYVLPKGAHIHSCCHERGKRVA